jgi:nucleoside-diphosphate-sugar epimerase
LNDRTGLKNKEILITGGLGFIGSNLAYQLVQQDARVTLFDARLEPYGWNDANIEEIKDDVRIVTADVRDREMVEKHVKGKDIVFHLAAQVGREISMQSPELDTQINCFGTLNICHACAKHDAKVVYAGSRGQIGEPQYLPVDEKHPTLPTDVYGINKLAAEKYLLLFSHIYKFGAVSLRLNNVYGPRCQMHHGFYGILNWFIGNAMQEKPITVYGDGQQTRDYVYIDDVVDAFIRVAVNEKANQQIFFVGSEVETVFLDMVKTVINAVGRGSYVHVPFPSERESIDIKKFVVSCEKLFRYTDWRAQTDLKTGVNKTVEFYRQRYSDYIKNG